VSRRARQVLKRKGLLSKMAKERFRDWNLYHKGVAAAIAAMVFWVLLRAILVIDGAFEVREEGIIEANPEEIWPYITENAKRDDWTAELMRVQGVSVEVGRNRFLYWKRRYDQWRSYEVTTGLVQNRVFQTEQVSDEDRRWWYVTLDPIAPCQTRVTFREVIEPLAYKDRFWFFRVEEARQKRLAYSLEALERKLSSANSVCSDETSK
jgi:uncharacterized protein YndB with AHSA1/START domain